MEELQQQLEEVDIGAQAQSEHVSEADASPAVDDLCPSGQQYYHESVLIGANGAVERRTCTVTLSDGTSLVEGGLRANIIPLDVFYSMFSAPYLDFIVRMTNEQLEAKSDTSTTSREVLSCFGMILLITRFQFARRSDLWQTRNRFIWAIYEPTQI